MDLIQKGIRWKLGNDTNTIFFIYIWVKDMPLIEGFT